MNDIANALAAARERTGQTGASCPAVSTAAATSPQSMQRRGLSLHLVAALGLGLVAVAVIGGRSWLARASVTVAPGAEAVVLPAGAGGQANVPALASRPQVRTPPLSNAPLGEPGLSAVARAEQRAEIAEWVAALPVSAVLPGTTPRVLLEGRIVQAGEVVQGELTFTGVQDGVLVFTDARGALYTRRY
jgi:hypothetical protein